MNGRSAFPVVTLALTAVLLLALNVSCKKKNADLADASVRGDSLLAAPSASAPPTMATAAAASGAASGGSTVPAAPAGTPPPDGKYERVVVDGVTVPMINVMEGGKIVLVDTDGKKPRTWEEQYKRKRGDLLTGQYDLHKTNTNKNDTFEDDSIDKEGLWIIDAKGNITKH